MTMNMTERTKMQKQRKSARQIIAICLALVMFLGSALAFDQAIAFQMQQNSSNEIESFDEWGLLEEWNLEYLEAFPLEYATNWGEWTSYDEIALFDETMSESRRNYFKLLEGGYNNYHLRQRFVELFGEGFSGEYIFHNYRTIFDLPEYKEIDSAFLRVLSGYRVDFRFQNTDNHNIRGLASDDGKVRIFLDSDLSTYREFVNAEDAMKEFDAAFLERIMNDVLEPEITYYYEVSDLQYDDVYVLFDTNRRGIEAFSNNLVSISLWSRANTSITVDMWFVSGTAPTNTLQIWDPGTDSWRWILSSSARTGTHTITGLSPGVTYLIAAGAWDSARQTWVHDVMWATTTVPTPNLISHSRSSVDFRLDRTFTDALGTSLTNSFLDATNQAFYVIRDFTGGPQFYAGGRMQIEHARNLPWYAEALSGWPILWQLTNVHGGGWFMSLDHAQRMRATGIETNDTPPHEIGHNFDNIRWSFEPEAIAILFTYHYYATTGRSTATAGISRTFRGGEYRTYMRSYANRMMGHINHEEAMRWGVYSPYSLAYILGTIAGQIGWQPFTDTFIHFHNMYWWEIPQTDLGKLNLFLTLLRDYSDRDVITMIPADARRIYDLYFGGWIGAIRYVTPTPATVITHPTQGQQIPRQTFNATWSSPMGFGATMSNNATYVVSLRNLCTDQQLINNRAVGTANSTSIAQNLLVAGNEYRIAVGRTANGRTTWSLREFHVQGGTVVPTGVTISPTGIGRIRVGQTRQFTATVSAPPGADTSVTWSTADSRIATVNANGLVTARAIGTTLLTVQTNSGNRSQSVVIDVGLVERGLESNYLAMGIGWPLGSREGDGLYIRENRNFNHISSAFGPRTDAELHMGIDIQRYSGGGAATRGTPVLAVVDGYVVHYVRRTFASGEEGTGYSISIRSTDPRHRDPATGHQLIFVHHHLQYAPILEMDRRVMRGQVIGFAGRTGAPRSQGHLHFEISSSGIATWGTTDRQVAIRNRINPRFFYSRDAFGGIIRIWEERNWSVPTS